MVKNPSHSCYWRWC